MAQLLVLRRRPTLCVRDPTLPSNVAVQFIDSPASLYRLAVAVANQIESRDRLFAALIDTISGFEIDAICYHNAHFGESLHLPDQLLLNSRGQSARGRA